MADYGLIGAIGQGLTSGVDAFMKRKKQNADVEKSERDASFKTQELDMKREDHKSNMELKRAEAENKKIYYDYLTSKAQGKQGKGGKIQGMIELAKNGLKGEWDAEGNLLGVSRDDSLPLHGRGGKDYAAEKGLIDARGEWGMKAAELRGRNRVGGKDYEQEKELQKLRNEGSLSVAQARKQNVQAPIGIEDRIRLQQEKTQGLIDLENVRQGGRPSKFRPIEEEKELLGLKNQGLVDREKARPVRPLVDNVPVQRERNQGLIDLEKLKQEGKQQKLPDDKESLQRLKNDSAKEIEMLRQSGALERAKLKPAPKAARGAAPKTGRPVPQTAYEKKKGTDLGKAVVEWRTKDRGQLDAEAKKVEDAIALLSGGDAETGGLIKSFTPDIGMKIFSPKTKEAQDSIHSAIQGSMRPTLGAQFTAGEGASMKALEFDKGLPTQENLRRAQNLLAKLRNNIAMKDALAEYVDAHGDDRGFPYQNYLLGSKHTAPQSGPVTKNPAPQRAKKAPGSVVPGSMRSEYSPTRGKTRFLDAQGKVLKILDGDQR